MGMACLLGWNAAVYVASEIPDAKRLIPRALVIGASVVAVLYVLLTLAFMRSIPSEAFVAGDDLELTVSTNRANTFLDRVWHPIFHS